MIGLFAMQYFSATSGLSTVLWAATMTAVIVRLAMSDRENKRAARAGADRPADRARQPRPHAGRPGRDLRAGERGAAGDAATSSTSTASSATTTPSATPPATSCWPGSASALQRRRRRRRRRLPDRRRRVLRAAHLRRRTASRRWRRARGRSADRDADRGVEVSASWGAATIPRRGGRPSAALQLADVRMYAQKESRRTAHADAVDRRRRRRAPSRRSRAARG